MIITLSDDEVQEGELETMDQLLGMNEDEQDAEPTLPVGADQAPHEPESLDATVFYEEVPATQQALQDIAPEPLSSGEPEPMPAPATPEAAKKIQVFEVSDSPCKAGAIAEDCESYKALQEVQDKLRKLKQIQCDRTLQDISEPSFPYLKVSTLALLFSEGFTYSLKPQGQAVPCAAEAACRTYWRD